MTPTPVTPAPLKWWQSLIQTIAILGANIGLSLLASHFGGAGAGLGVGAATTGAAYLAKSPLQK